MTREEYEAAKTTLGKRALNMLLHMEHGRFYPVEQYAGSSVMDELLHAGLVQRAGRVQTIVACFVPAYGFYDLVSDRIDVETEPYRPNLIVAAPELLEALRDLCICVSPMSDGTVQMDKLIPAYTKACKAIWKAEGRS